MKIVVLEGYTLNQGDLTWKGLERLGDLTVYDRTPAEQTLERAKDAEIVFTNKNAITAEMLENMPKLKYIGVLATGYNVVDIKAAKERGVTVTNIPAYGTEAVAQMTFALLLELCNHAGEHNKAVKKGEWSKCRDFCFWKHSLIELAGKNIGIIGYGRIGHTVGEIAKAFGMNVLVYSRDKNKESQDEKVKYVEFDELLSESDVITLHCPLTEETEGIINKDTIDKMKDGVMIVNTARGKLIKEDDLAEALNSGKVSGAGLDVLSEEPPQSNNPLTTAKNTIITPHIAWAPKEARERLLNIAIENLDNFLVGKPTNVVNS